MDGEVDDHGLQLSLWKLAMTWKVLIMIQETIARERKR